MKDKLFGIASKVASPLSLVSVVVIVLYEIFIQILKLNIFSVLSDTQTYQLVLAIADRIFYFALFTLILGITAFIWIQYLKGEFTKVQEKRGIILKGNIYHFDGRPATKATITIVGMKGDYISDSTGFFEIELSRQKSWIIRASCDSLKINQEVLLKDIKKPLVLKFPETSSKKG